MIEDGELQYMNIIDILWMKVQRSGTKYNCPRNMIKAFLISEKQNKTLCLHSGFRIKINNCKRETHS